MAVNFLNDVNFNGNEALNMVVHKSTSATRPVNPVDGQLTFDTDLRTIMSYNLALTSWVSVSDEDALLDAEGTAPIQVSEDGNRKITISVDDATTTSLGVITLAGDLGGSAAAPSVEYVGGKTASSVAGAVDLAHTQNTDTGTDSTDFQIDSSNSGPRISNAAGTVELRNSDNTDFANLHVKDLVVEGSSTVINSNEVNIGDSEILLNSDITTNAENSDGGVAVKRLLADNTTRADAKVVFNNTTGRWQIVDGATTAPTTFDLSRTFTATIGDGAATSYVVTHNMNTRNLAVTLRDTAAPYAVVLTDVEMTTANTITVKFKKAPAAGAYTVTLVG